MCLFEPNSSFIMHFLTSLKATKISSCNIVNETSYIIANMIAVKKELIYCMRIIRNPWLRIVIHWLSVISNPLKNIRIPGILKHEIAQSVRLDRSLDQRKPTKFPRWR